MQGIDFEQRNIVFKGPPGSDIYDMPAHNDGRQSICCFKMSPKELEQVNASGGIVWLCIMAGSQFPPVVLQTETPFIKHPDAFMGIYYAHALTNSSVTVWNAVDAPAPLWFRGADNRTYIRDDAAKPPQPIGREAFVARQHYYIRSLTEQEAKFPEDMKAPNEHGLIMCQVLVGSMVIPAEHEQQYALVADNWEPIAKPASNIIALKPPENS